jgi:fumarate hydratase subunit beta
MENGKREKQNMKYLELPLNDESVAELRVGDKVLISGPVVTLRDASSRRLSRDIKEGRPPINLSGRLVFYMGPTPAPPGRPIGAAGPTTSARMDKYVPELINAGVSGFMGKGRRSDAAKLAMLNGHTVYLVATGGIGAFLSRHVGEAGVAAYPDLGPEAMYELTLDEFPAVVADDIYGGDLFDREWEKWKSKTKTSS